MYHIRYPNIAELLVPKILPRSSLTLLSVHPPPLSLNLPLSALVPPPAPLQLGATPISSRGPPQLRQFRRVCSEIVPGELYVSGSTVAEDWSLLQKHGITHVINLACTSSKSPFPNRLEYLCIALPDSSTADIEGYLYLCIDFIQTVLTQSSSNRVLVHCMEGVSRSCAVAIAYLMWKNQLDFSKANELVVAKRPICDPNFGFISQLFQFHSRLLRTSPSVVWRLSPQLMVPVRCTTSEDPQFVYIRSVNDTFSIQVGSKVSDPEKAIQFATEWIERIARIENFEPHIVEAQ